MFPSHDQGRIFIAKNRNGPDGMIYNIFMDTSNVSIRTLPNTPRQNTPTGVVTAPFALDAKQQQDYLKQKYTKLRRK